MRRTTLGSLTAFTEVVTAAAFAGPGFQAMRRTMLASLTTVVILAVVAGTVAPVGRASAAEGKGKANPGLLGWATFPAQSNAPGKPRSTAAGTAKKGKSSTYLRMGQPPAGTSSTAAKKKPPPSSTTTTMTCPPATRRDGGRG